MYKSGRKNLKIDIFLRKKFQNKYFQNMIRKENFFKGYLKECIQNSTIHGLNYLLKPNLHWIERYKRVFVNNKFFYNY